MANRNTGIITFESIFGFSLFGPPPIYQQYQSGALVSRFKGSPRLAPKPKPKPKPKLTSRFTSPGSSPRRQADRETL